MKITDEQIVANILRFNKEVTELNVKYSEEIEELKQENEKLHSIIKELNKEINELLNMALEQDKENVNLIDRLKILLEILDKGNK